MLGVDSARTLVETAILSDCVEPLRPNVIDDGNVSCGERRSVEIILLRSDALAEFPTTPPDKISESSY